MGRSLFFWFGALLAFGLWIGYGRLQDGALGHRIQQLRAAVDSHLPAGWGGKRQETAKTTVFYRWRDAQGVDHLSDTPRQGAERIVVHASRTMPATPTASASQGERVSRGSGGQGAHAAAGRSVADNGAGQDDAGDGRPDLFGIRQGLEKKLQDSQDQQDRQIDRDSGH